MLTFNKWFWSKALVYLIDVLIVNIGFFSFYLVEKILFDAVFEPSAIPYLVIANITYIISLFLFPTVVYYRWKNPTLVINQVFKLVLMHLLLFYAMLSVFNLFSVNILHVLSFYAFFLVAMLAYRYLLWKMIGHLRLQGKNNKKIVLVGEAESINKVIQVMDDFLMGYSIVGIFSDDEKLDKNKLPMQNLKKIGKVADLLDFCKTMKQNEDVIDEIYCGLPLEQFEDFSTMLDFCENNMIRFFFVPTQYNFVPRNLKSTQIANLLVLSVREEPLQDVQNIIVKRIFDIVVSSLFLILIYPFVFVIVGTLIKLSSKGPIYFIQKRTGMNGKIFNCIKFRSMVQNEQCDDVCATRNDPRKTKIGAWLRKTNLDELPQFINVLRGEMSVVGPRPHMLKHTDLYASMVNHYAVRLLVKPGITGMAQCKGFRGEVSKVEDIQQRVKWDVWYLENWSFFLDIKIVFLTILKMIKGDENAY